MAGKSAGRPSRLGGAQRGNPAAGSGARAPLRGILLFSHQSLRSLLTSRVQGGGSAVLVRETGQPVQRRARDRLTKPGTGAKVERRGGGSFFEPRAKCPRAGGERAPFCGFPILKVQIV